MTEQPNVVLVHGAFADGSSWSTVVQDLQTKGYQVTAPQFPQTSLADDVARLRQALAWQNGPDDRRRAFLRRAGHDRPWCRRGDVVALVYIAAFGLDEGESINALGADAPPPPALANIIVDEHGFGRLPEEDFVGHFAADVDPVMARVMHAVQQPVSMSVFDDIMGTPAWKSRPSWYLVAADDEAIAPDAERMFAQRMGAETVEVAASHVAMVSHPEAVVGLVDAAASATAQAPAAAGTRA